jgi:hypothetical protein
MNVVFDVRAAAIIAMSSPQLAPVDTTTVTVQEDEHGWSCAEMGYRICGPNNSEGVPAGDYSQR